MILHPTRSSVRLDPGAYRALWRHLDLGESPLLLDLPDHGDTLARRDALDRAAWTRLVGAGLVDAADRVHPDLADALTVLRTPAVEVDAREFTAGGRRGWLAAARAGITVGAHLDDDGLALQTSEGDDPATVLIGLLPAVPAADGDPVRAPAAGVDADPAGRRRGLVAAGLRAEQAGRLAGWMSREPVRTWSLGAARRDATGRRHRGPRALTVVDVDTPGGPGRILVERSATTVTFTPATPPRLAAWLRELLDEAGPPPDRRW